MASHVVDYKLCDKSFDCEHCDFDNVMRNRSHIQTVKEDIGAQEDGSDMLDRILNSLMTEYPNKRSIYLPGNLVLDELPDRTYRISLSSLAIRFLDNVFSVVPCRQGERIRKGQACVTLSGAWGGLTVMSPIHFLFLDKSEDGIGEGPMRGVLGIIQSEKGEIERERLSQQEWQQQLIGLSRKLVRLKEQVPEIPSMSRGAGGRFLYQRIGKDNYFEILNFLFKQKIRIKSL